jgi:hypothetical protein
VVRPVKRHLNPLLLGSIIIFSLFITIIGYTMFGMDKFYKNSSNEQRLAVKKAIQRAVVQCYALEGAYPPDLEYLVKNYGIVLNETKFFYQYEIFASNIAPQVEVLSISIEKGDKNGS